MQAPKRIGRRELRRGPPFFDERKVLASEIRGIKASLERITSRPTSWVRPSATMVWEALYDFVIAPCALFSNSFQHLPSRRPRVDLPRPEDPRLVFFVREAFLGSGFQTGTTSGCLQESDKLSIMSEMNTGGVV